jgi:hypothetical protein
LGNVVLAVLSKVAAVQGWPLSEVPHCIYIYTQVYIPLLSS